MRDRGGDRLALLHITRAAVRMTAQAEAPLGALAAQQRSLVQAREAQLEAKVTRGGLTAL